MTTSKIGEEAFVWIWLPGEVEPVVAGKIARDGDLILFAYGKSYLARKNAIAIFAPELPLQAGTFKPKLGLKLPSCIRDAAPDAWGRRVIINRLLGRKGSSVDTSDLSEIVYLLESNSDRIGALDFQLSSTNYIPRGNNAVEITELIDVVASIEKGQVLPEELAEALLQGSSIGGARPKATIVEENVKYIAKFSSSLDPYNVVKGEFIAMKLAALVGINVARVKLVQALSKDVLLVERFDRTPTEHGWARKSMVSALTLLGLDELMARYASYEEISHIIRHQFYDPNANLIELYKRLIFNVLCGNNDDHARNHAAFWDGIKLTLTPAYDICPQLRAGGESSQAMSIIGDDKRSNLQVCINAAKLFQLKKSEAKEIVDFQIHTIEANWDEICVLAELTASEKNYFWRRQFLNPSVFYKG